MMKEAEESRNIKQNLNMAGKDMGIQSRDIGQQRQISPDLQNIGQEPSLIQYRSKRRCVMEREKKTKKEWWEEENVLSDEEEYVEDADSDSSDNPKRRRKRKDLMPMSLLPPPPNRIYVFSTELANRAADAVVQGRVPSIVAYHRAQPQNQNLLRVHRNNPGDFGMNHAAMGNMNPYRFGNYAGHMGKMEGMFPGKSMGDLLEGQVAGRGGMPQLGGLGGGFNNIHQYQQYLKQQQQQPQHEARTTIAGVNDIQQMLFGAPNGGSGKGMMPPSVDGQVGPQPPYGFPPGFRPQQMMTMDGQPEERFRFPQPQQPQNYPNSATQQQQVHIMSQQQQNVQQQPPSSQQPLPTGTQPSHLPPVLSPSSSASSSSPHGTTIRSPPPYPNPRAAEPNTLPGASTAVGAPSPTSVSSPQTPHGPLTPRLPTSLASPKDGQRPPFSPSPGTGGVQTSQGNFTSTGPQQNTGTAMKQHPLARQSPSLENPEEKASISSPYQPMMSDSRVSFHGQEGTSTQQRPNSLDLPREDPQSLPPPNRSPFLPGTSSPMAIRHHNPLASSTASPHHPSKSFSVESLTAPHDKARLYRPTIQGASPYAYAQQPGLFYPGQKFPPAMLGQGQYQFPPHMQPAPQQFFPPNLPPNMYLPRSSFPIHHAGNREGGL